MKDDKFKYIRVEFDEERQAIFDVDDFTFDEDIEECAARNIIWGTISFSGIPQGLTEEEYEDIYEKEHTNVVPIGQLRGCLVLCSEIIDEGFDPLDLCDSVHGDVFFMMEVLTAKGQPLNNAANPLLKVFYIHSFEMNNAHVSPKLAGRILKELPKLVHLCFHVRPDILAFYPAPVKEEGDGQNSSMRSTEVHAGHSGPIELLPDSIRHLEEYLLFRANGFSEAGVTGLLYWISEDAK